MRWVLATLICAVLSLVAIGITMLASSSSARSINFYHTPYYFVSRQVMWLCISAVAGAVMAFVDYRKLRKFALPLMLVVLALLVATLVPGIGKFVNGSRRWLAAGPVNIQTSELAKFVVVLFLAAKLQPLWSDPDRTLRSMLWPLGGLGAALGLIFFEPDFGTTILLAATGMAMMFIAGARLRYVFGLMISGTVAMSILIMMDEVRMRRILAFLDLDKYAEKEGFQLVNSLYAFISGGIHGSGLGNSLQKLNFLPECHTDFILPIIGEELGLFATLAVLLLFVILCACGMIISWKAADPFGRLLAFGITTLISMQAAINIAVVTGCLPTKGLALPFISYGGSSLVVSGMMIGVLCGMIRIHIQETGPDARMRGKDRIRSI